MLLGMLCAGAFAGCRLQPREIEFVVPDGFRGPFLIIEHPDGQSGDFRNGKLSLEIPPSRILTVKDDSAFDEWTTRSARYQSGIELPLDHEVDASHVALRGGGESAGVRRNLVIPQHMSFFVGTDADFDECDFTELENQIATER
jgi:hypothetical protein